MNKREQLVDKLFEYWLKEDFTEADFEHLDGWIDFFEDLYIRKPKKEKLQSDWLKRPKAFNQRRIGNTTRLVDYYIQKLFRDGCIKPEDHHSTLEADRRLTDLIRNRLYQEHPHLTLRINKANEIGL